MHVVCVLPVSSQALPQFPNPTATSLFVVLFQFVVVRVLGVRTGIGAILTNNTVLTVCINRVLRQAVVYTYPWHVYHCNSFQNFVAIV